MRRKHRILTPRIPGLLAGVLLVTTGCASRGFVRNEVGATSEILTARIDENETGLNTARQDIDEVDEAVEAQSTRLDQTEQNLDATRDELRDGLASTRTEISEVRGIAEDAAETADAADERSRLLADLFGDRNRYNVEASHNFYFDFDSAALKDDSSTELEAVSQAIASDPGIMIVLEGRTDSQGDENYNVSLGERRIEAVTRYLVVQLGVPVYRIHSFSFGEAEPLFPNTDIESRGKNRVVTLTLLAPASSAAQARSGSSFED